MILDLVLSLSNIDISQVGVDIDKLSTKFNQLGDTMTTVDKVRQMAAEGISSANIKAVLETNNLCDAEIQEALSTVFANTQKEKHVFTTLKQTAAQKALTAAMTIGNVVLTMAAGIIISIIATKFAEWISGVIQKQKELNRTMDESIEVFETLSSEIKSINDELKTTESRIEELNNKENLSFVEQEELERLKEQNEELDRELKYKQALKDIEKEKLEKDARGYFGSISVNTPDSDEYNYSGDYLAHLNYVAGNTSEDTSSFAGEKNVVDEAEERLVSLEELGKKIKETEATIRDLETKTEEDYAYKSTWNQSREQLEQAKKDLESYEKDYKDLRETSLDDWNNINTYSKFLNPDVDTGIIEQIDAYNEIADLLLEVGKSKEEKFNEVWNSDEFSEHKKELIDLSKAGKLDADVLSSNDEYNKLVEAIGGNAQSAASHINSMVEAAKVEKSKQDFSEAFSALPINEIEKYIGLLNSGELTASNLSEYDELNNLLKETGISASDAYSKLEEFADGYKLSIELTEGIQEAYNVLEDVKKEFKETKLISLDTLSTIAEKFPELSYATTAYAQGLMTVEELLELLEQAYEDDVDNYRTLMLEKLAYDETFFEKVVTNNEELFTELAETYSLDLKNYKELAKAKADVDSKLITALATAWGQYYDTVIGADGKMGLAFEGDESIDQMQADKEIRASIQPLIDQRNALYEAIEEAKLEVLLPDFGGIGKDKDGSGSGSDSDSNKEEEIDWIERKKEIYERLHSINEEIADDETASYKDRAKALEELIRMDKERVDEAHKDASQYEQAWLEASKNLSDDDKNFIKHGGDIIKKYNAQEMFENGEVESLEAGEQYIENIGKAQELYDKYQDSLKEESDRRKKVIDYQRQQIQLLKDQIAAQQDLNSAITDQINSKKELAEVQGEYIGKAYYENLISQSKKQESLIKDQIDALYEELDLADEETAERERILVEIENCKNELIQCQVEQAELNDTILRLPIERLQMFRDLYAQIIEDMDNYRSIQDKMGLNPTKEELQTYIDLYAESIDNTIKQQDQLKNLLKNYSYGSDKYKETMDEIQGLDNEISNLIASQIELNHQMLQIPVTEMSEEIDKLGTYKEALNNAIAEDNANGLKTTVDQYKDLHNITLQQLNLYALQKAELTKLLDVYDENSQYYKDTEQQIADIDSQMSSLVQETYQWNQELLNIPIENLEKVNENLSSYSSILGDVITSYDEALEGVNALVDAEIEGIQDQLDLLNETNEARKIQLALEQAQYNLEKARNQKTTKVIRDGEVTYEANVDDLRSAQQELADAQYDKMVYDLEQQIERLEDIKEKWADIIEAIEKAKDLQAAEDLFGAGWQDSVLADTDGLRDLFQSLYESTSKEKEAVDKQIESNDRLSQMMNEFVTRYQEGSLTYEEALSGISTMISSMKGGFSAFEQLSGMMDLDNIASLGEIASSAEASITGSAELLEKYLGIVESNKADVENFETNWGVISEGVQDVIDSFNVAVDSMDGYIEAFQSNAKAINANTNTWEEMKELIEEQVEALKKAAEELEKSQKNASSSNHSGGSSSSNKSDDDDGVYISAGGNSYHESTGTAAEIIGTYGTDAEKEAYEKYRTDQINAKADKSGDEGWRDAALKALEEELKEAGIKKYHTGILKGPVGFSPLSNDEIYSFAKRVAVNPLKADEVMAILQKGELVTQPEQMSNIMRNNQLIGQMAAEQANSAIRSINNVTRDNVVDFSIGEIHLHEVQNVDEFAKALSQTFASSMQQNFSKIFKY